MKVLVTTQTGDLFTFEVDGSQPVCTLEKGYGTRVGGERNRILTKII